MPLAQPVNTERQVKDPSACIIGSMSTEVMEKPESSSLLRVSGNPAAMMILSSGYPNVFAAYASLWGTPIRSSANIVMSSALKSLSE